MNTSIETLGRVVDLALKRRDEALAALAGLQRELAQAQDQMNQLQAYAQEAHERWASRSATGVDAALLMHHRQFMAKIEHAMEFQRHVLNDRQALVGRSQAAVYEAERDLAGLRKFAERKQQTIDELTSRRDQKMSDEMAINIHRRYGDNNTSFRMVP